MTTDGSSGVLDRFMNKQAGIWMLVSVSAFTVGVLAAEAAGLSPGYAFTAGFALSLPLELVRDWLLDWVEIEQEVFE